ncbi:MAG TPA: transporter [Candidatus Krumholzibacteria bacterium]|nr:transporter [Candidatus Krumholzibacteria bacterium]
MNRSLCPVTTLLAFTIAVATASPRVADAERAFVTDRPGRTDSPYSVAPERFQIETDFASYGEYRDDGTTVKGMSVAAFNVKYGFTPSVDVQLLFTPYTRTSTSSAGTSSVNDGTGPLGMRFKINLLGNDSGDVALAVLPYAFTPTRGANKQDNTLYGVTVPVALALGGGRSLGAAAGVERLGDSDTFGVASLAYSTPVRRGWGGFVELYGHFDGFGDEDEQIATLDVGAVFVPSDDLQFDAGLYYGLTSDTEDWRLFAGVSARR